MGKTVWYIIILIIGVMILMSTGIVGSGKSISAKHNTQLEQILNETEE